MSGDASLVILLTLVATISGAFPSVSAFESQ